ncbi:MBOAT (membrane bound O-acyl transferase) family protein [Artemisia annua]|uniref:MBOAT (Membrane bound O-acyl transferase) family protein n=1 Tax=Artemisia annua TaxID=35608 RepID=A0A2U1LYZ9_ARTAN|nr:MBOAT (membrane bound O-acyl transferase) family protein [Artemisia annua]
METIEELQAFIKVFVCAIFSMSYCYLIPLQISNGIPRLLSILPIIATFFILPLPLSTANLTFFTFFCLVWLSNFKLLLLSFNCGPLASKPRLPFLVFLSTALLPTNPKKFIKMSRPDCGKVDATKAPSHKPIVLAFKAVILAMIISSYQYKDNFYHRVVILYFLYMYLGMELSFAMAALFVKFYLGFNFEIEPQFNEPHLATSLQDFWGRRWNLMSSSILRHTVYNPIRNKWDPILGQLKGQMFGILVTFFVSGIMHELIFLYTTRVQPTWEVTCFFVLHGACTAIEVAVKKAVKGRFQLHRGVTWPITMAFMVVTGGWLLFPQLIRNRVDVKAIQEILFLVNFARSKWERNETNS